VFCAKASYQKFAKITGLCVTCFFYMAHHIQLLQEEEEEEEEEEDNRLPSQV
jgi:hypothetical protein